MITEFEGNAIGVEDTPENRAALAGLLALWEAALPPEPWPRLPRWQMALLWLSMRGYFARGWFAAAASYWYDRFDRWVWTLSPDDSLDAAAHALLKNDPDVMHAEEVAPYVAALLRRSMHRVALMAVCCFVLLAGVGLLVAPQAVDLAWRLGGQAAASVAGWLP